MYQLVLLIHVLVSAFIVLLVLIQQGKGATMGAAFGSGASQTVFGSRGSGSFLFRLTMGCLAVFFVTSISLNYIAKQAYKEEKIITMPAIPATKVPAKQTPATSAPVVPIEKSESTQPLTDQIPVKK
jgi:preprotein translocase subunit SecG